MYKLIKLAVIGKAVYMYVRMYMQIFAVSAKLCIHNYYM